MFTAGLVGIVLGILALVNIVPLVLTTIALLLFGIGLILGSGLTARLESLEHGVNVKDSKATYYELNRYGLLFTIGVQVLLGLTAVVLAILSLVGVASGPMTVVGLLIVGIATFISGAAISNRLTHLLRGS